jgi:hypothetical protein
MRIIKEELWACVDVDWTLVMHDGEGKRNAILIKSPSGVSKWYVPHRDHIDLIKDWKARGYFITVWSANGWEWAKIVTEALGLEYFVDEVRSKPLKHVDDKTDSVEIIGPRIYIPFRE